LGQRKIYARFVSHNLCDEEKLRWLDAWNNFVKTDDSEPDFLNTVIIGHESWCYQYDPDTKRHSAEWQSPSLPRPKRFISRNHTSKPQWPHSSIPRK
jgi:hypothetical protein